jgi:CRP-like cAMP-binding protein
VLRTGDQAGKLGFVSRPPHSANLRSLGQTQICTLGREHFETLLETEPHLVCQVMRNIVRAARNILRRMNTK